MPDPSPIRQPVVLIGAFERHNFGDLLMGRVLEHYLREAGFEPIFASIFPADLRSFGGSRVCAFADLAPTLPPDVPIVHVGGETVTCTLRDALKMNVPVGITRKLAGSLSKLTHVSGLDDRQHAFLTPPAETILGKSYTWTNRYFYGIGGHSLAQQPEAVQESIRKALTDTIWLGVRDDETAAGLKALNFPNVKKQWDAGVLVPSLHTATATGNAATRKEEKEGYLLVHANAHFLSAHTAELVAAIRKVSFLFVEVCVALAGVAANHDSPALSEALVTRLQKAGVEAKFEGTLHADEITRLIERADCVISTSLHYRIIALAYGVPRISLANAKVASWAGEWDAYFPASTEIADLPGHVLQALDFPTTRCEEIAQQACFEATIQMWKFISQVKSLTTAPGLALSHPVPSISMVQIPAAWLGELSLLATEAQTAAQAAKQDLHSTKAKLQTTREQLAAYADSWLGKIQLWFRKK